VEERNTVQLPVVEGEDAVAAFLQVGGEPQPVVDGVTEGAVDQDDGTGMGGDRTAVSWVTTSIGLEAELADGTRIVPPWAN
jgi:hypothetical protein